MRVFYIFLFLCFFSLPSYGQEYSCVDKKYSRLSKMSIKDDALTFINERGSVQEYKIIDNSHKHVGHKFYTPEKFHLQLKIKSSYLNSISKLSAQKMIMKILSKDLRTKIHALEISIEK